MATMSLEQALQLAVQHHDAGRLPQAESIYRQILKHAPDHPETLRMLGLLAFQCGRGADAVPLIRRAIAGRPAAADFHSNLGVILATLGQLDEAVMEFRRSLVLNPADPETSINLGNALQQKHRFDEAVELYKRAIQIRPDVPEAYYNLGKALQEKGDLAGAIDAYNAAIAQTPNHADAYNNLGNALKNSGRTAEAIAAFQKALSLRANFPEAYYNLGAALKETGDTEQEIAAYQKAVALRPEYAEAQNNLGNALEEKGRPDEAIGAYRQALASRANFPEAHNNLGNALLELGRLDEAIAAYRQALALKPGYAEAHNNLGNALKESGRLDEALESYRKAAGLSNEPRVAGNLLYVLHFHPDYSPRQIHDEHARWNDKYAKPLAAAHRPHANPRDPNKPLKIGYVSPDFREHPVGRFMLPLMASHDRVAHEIVCYTDLQIHDGITARLKSHADVWRPTAGMSDQQLADAIRADGIDVLVDLTMHLKGSRLLAFARKPASVQVTYLAYCSTTGVTAIDYRLTDPHLDPPDVDESLYAEKTVRLPRTYWCYPPPDNSPDVGPLPSRAGQITFGCLNNYSKVTPGMLSVWCRILQAVPASRLILHAHDGTHRQLASDLLAREGVDPARLVFHGFQPLEKYLEQYHQVDVALDPFPYGGGTTTCDALWMGVPVVSLSGATAVSRAGRSILTNVGLPELVGDSQDRYVEIATTLAGDLPRLEDLRRTLRPRLQASPLMNPTQFARDVEAAYRTMWRGWCENRAG